MNRILLSMSTFPKSLSDNSFVFDMFDDYKVTNCRSQLEPVPTYMYEVLGGKLEIIVLSSADTRKISSVDTDEGTKYIGNPCTYFMERMLDRFKIDCDGRISSEILLDTEYDFGNLIFRFIDIDENNPKPGIEKSLNYIKANPIGPDNQFWIDTHGGFRDTALMLNAVVSLLKVYKIYPDRFLGVRFGHDNENKKIVSQESSFMMFDFVAGMNEFIKFGSADTLAELLKDTGDGNVNQLINSMKIISDGTRLCDPALYIRGLEELRDVIDRVDSDDQIITLFIDYIKSDYGVLLTDEWSALDIVERCYYKKLYQQALTFAESLMPDVFVDKKVLYYDAQYETVICEIKKKNNASRIKSSHYVFDQYVNTVNFYDDNNISGWNSLTKDEKMQYGNDGDKNDKRKLDYEAIRAFKDLTNDLSTDYICKNADEDCYDIMTIKDFNKNEIGKIEIFTDVKNGDALEKTGRLIRLHKAIKRCRNMTNHASEKRHPSIDQIENALAVYVSLAREILDENNMEHTIKSSRPENCCIVKQAQKKKDSSNKKASNNSAAHAPGGKTAASKYNIPNQLLVEEAMRKAGKKKIRGRLANEVNGCARGTVLAECLKNIADISVYKNKTLDVIVTGINGEYCECKTVDILE